MTSTIFGTLTRPWLTATIHYASSFTQIYDTLPPEAQRTLLESYLVPLLDDLPNSVSTKVLNTAKEMQTRFTGIPKLDYITKRTELEGLLNEIERDQKQSLYVKERSTREKLFEETIDSLSMWVNDIWSVTFEYQTNFRLAHQCLLLAAEILRRAFAPFGGCVLFHLPLNYRWRGILDVTVPL
jgi:plasmid maintenance system killer protein